MRQANQQAQIQRGSSLSHSLFSGKLGNFLGEEGTHSKVWVGGLGKELGESWGRSQDFEKFTLHPHKNELQRDDVKGVS